MLFFSPGTISSHHIHSLPVMGFRTEMLIKRFSNTCLQTSKPVQTGYLIPNYSNNYRKINAIKYLHGGKISFGEFKINSLGNAEGSPGGYGNPPKNKY